MQSCRKDGTLQVWSIENGQLVSTLKLNIEVCFVVNVPRNYCVYHYVCIMLSVLQRSMSCQQPHGDGGYFIWAVTDDITY